MGVAVRLNRYLKNGLKIFFKSLKEKATLHDPVEELI